MRVATIFVRHGTSAYQGAEERLAGIFRQQLPGVERYTLVVDNALAPSFVDEEANRVVLGGDNSVREFSAFDRGVAWLGRKIWDFDFVHLATSAFNTLYTAYLDQLDMAQLAAIRDQPVCLGHVDCYGEAVEIHNHRSQHWIRSCFVVLPPAEIKALKSLVSLGHGARFFTGDPSRPFRDDAPLSHNYKRYIQDWLRGQDIGQGVRWHSSFELTQETLAAFEKKTLCILNEHLLSIRLRAQGCRLIDVTWLASALSGTGGIAPHVPPDWKSQLAERAADALVIP